MEYIIRFVCSPRKWRFFKQPMNLVDFFAIIPFLLDLVIGGLQVPRGGGVNNSEDWGFFVRNVAGVGNFNVNVFSVNL